MPRFTMISDLLNAGTGMIKVAIPAVIALCFFAFFWGTGRFIFKSGEGDKKGEQRTMLLYAFIGVFVVVTIFGLVALAQNLFSITAP